ncbi:3-phenylpropionate/cinnamic acid dioxygenase subunit beta [Acidocella sp.]|uniref:3-phenylpropionate/cinnamic acid dioxygenase subunit beta n=1 Tax=Acidocella sp. TaxID=50710 RepID=UPI003D012EFD
MDDLSVKTHPPINVCKTSPELQHEVERFLYLEAALQDEHRFREWLEFLSEDVRYTLSTNTLAQARDRRRGIVPPTTYIFDDNKYTLERRVARLETGMAWAEEPQSRTRRFIANVRITGQDNDEVKLSCNYIVHRAAKARDHHTFYGTRHDTLRRHGNGWLVVRRDLELDEFVLMTANISIFL